MTGQVTATFEGLDRGTVTFRTNTADGVLRDPGGNVLWVGPYRVRIVDGAIDVTLPATDDTAYAETEWQWCAEVVIDGRSSGFLRWFELPDGGAVDLSSIAGELAPGDPLTHPITYADVVADIEDPDSVIGGAVAVAAELGDARSGNINHGRAALAADGANFTILFLGDSKYKESNYGYTAAELRDRQNLKGMPLEGAADANILFGGSPGLTATDWLAGSGDFDQNDYLAVAADLNVIVVDFTTNRFRVAGATIATFLAEMDLLVAYLHEHSPNADIMLPTMFPFTTTVVGTDYLSGATATQAQARSDLGHQAVLAMRGRYSYVEVVDFAADVIGTIVTAASIHHADQIHWSGDGQIAFAQYIAGKIGARRPIAMAPTNTRYSADFEIAETNVNWVRLRRLHTTDRKAPAAGISTTDTIYADGLGAVSLSTATFTTIDANRIQIGINGAGWTNMTVNGVATVVGDHAEPGVQDGMIEVNVDCPSLTAGATDEITITVTGVHYADKGLIVEAGYMPPGIFWNHFVSNVDTVKIRFFNATGGTLDPSSQPWRFWLAR